MEESSSTLKVPGHEKFKENLVKAWGAAVAEGHVGVTGTKPKATRDEGREIEEVPELGWERVTSPVRDAATMIWAPKSSARHLAPQTFTFFLFLRGLPGHVSTRSASIPECQGWPVPQVLRKAVNSWDDPQAKAI